jgi:hypothetical protein
MRSVVRSRAAVAVHVQVDEAGCHDRQRLLGQRARRLDRRDALAVQAQAAGDELAADQEAPLEGGHGPASGSPAWRYQRALVP